MILARVADDQLSHQGASQIKEPLGLGALFKGQMNRATEAAQEIADGFGVGLQDGLGDQLAAEVKDSGGNSCLMNIESDLLAVRHRRPPSGSWSLAIPSYHRAPFQGNVRRGNALPHLAFITQRLLSELSEAQGQ